MQFSTVTYEVEMPVFSLSQTFYLYIHLLFGSGITKKSDLFRVSEKICVQMTNYKDQFDIRHRTFVSALLFSFSRISFPTTSFHQYLSFSSTGAIRDGATLAIFCSYNLQISHKHLTCKTPTVLEATNTHMHVHALPHTHTIYNFSINYKNDHVVSFFLYFFTFVFKLHTQSLDIWKCAEISLQRYSFI